VPIRSATPVRDPDRYEILGEHGRGGLGRVSRAHDKDLGRDIAIKELLSRGHVQELRFVREAMVTARLEHPGIVPVYEAGRWPDGTPFYAMKLVSGRPLRALIAERKTVDERLGLLHHVVAVADAIAYAHGRNIIHRDLKPANVIVGEFGETVVIDWGLAKDLSDSVENVTGGGMRGSGDNQLTSAGSVLGTPAYMAPEQERGESVDQRADVFAIGAMLWELCSLQKVPPANVAQRHRLLRRAGIDRDLIVIIDKAIDPDPLGRYADAGALAADLKAFKSGARILAREYSLSALLSHWTRRHRALAVSVLAFSILLVLSVAALGVLYQSSSQNARIAQQRLVKSYVQQGRHSLLDGRSAEAVAYLSRAVRGGESSPNVGFMLARAAQSRLMERVTLTSGGGRMWSGRFSPDGRQVVTTHDHDARIWHAQTGELLFTLPHEGLVFEAAYHPQGKKLITSTRQGTLRVWDPATGGLIQTLAPPASEDTQASYIRLVMSTNANIVGVAARERGLIHLWDLATSRLVTTIERGEHHLVSAVAFSSDDRWLVVMERDAVQVFETAAWKPVLRIPVLEVNAMEGDPTGLRLVTATRRGDVSIWDLASGVRTQHLMEAGEPLSAVAFSSDGSLVAAGGELGTVALWHTRTGEPAARLDNHRGMVTWLEFDRSSTSLLSLGADRSLVVSDVETGAVLSTLEGPRAFLRAAHFDPTGQQVVGASWDGTARIWDARPSYRRWTSKTIGRECGVGVRPDDDRKLLAVSCGDAGTHVWDTSRDALVAELPGTTAVGGWFNSATAVISAASNLVAIPRGSVVELYHLPSGRHARTVTHESPVTSIAFASQGDVLVSGSTDGAVLVTGGGLALTSLPSSATAIDVVGFVADGRVITADQGGRLRVYDGAGAIVAELALPGRVRAFRSSPDSRRLVTIASTALPGASVLWDLDRYIAIANIGDDKNKIFSARFEAHGHEILTASNDGVARLWDSTTGRLLQSYVGSSEYLLDAARSPDGSMVVTAGGMGVLRFWDASTGSLLWMLRAHQGIISEVRFEGNDLVTRGFTGEITRWSFPDSVVPALMDRVLRCLPVRFDEGAGALVEQAPCSEEAGPGPGQRG
jgi:WD40 repeat protein/serine/threonine protein kinase